jgi:hypothetical protein
MANPNALIADAAGLQSQPNELTLPAGSLSVAENVEITRDGVIEVARGFEDYSENLPDFTPEQILVVGGVAYCHLDSGLWYKDATSGNWYRKRGNYGTALDAPVGAVVVDGHLYVTSASHVIFDIDLATGERTALAGRFGSSGSTDGTGGSARFSMPYGICSDGSNLYVSDLTASTVRKVVIATGVVTTLAGTFGATGTTDGVGAVARFNSPHGLAYDAGAVYVCDFGNDRLRKLDLASATVSTLATGLSLADGVAVSGNTAYVSCAGSGEFKAVDTASGATATVLGGLTAPRGAAIIGNNIYFCDTAVYSSPLASPAASLLAGGGVGSSDAIGAAAAFNFPRGLCSDGANLYVCDYSNNTIRKVYVDTAYVSTVDGIVLMTGLSAGLPLANGIVVGPPE